MQKLSDIEISKSIETGYLIGKRSWFDIISRIVFAMIFIELMISTSMSFFDIDFNDPKDRASFFTILFPIVFLVALYGLYRIIFENRLTCIETSFEQNKNYEILCNFLKEFQYDIFRNTEEIIIVNDENELSLSGLWSKTITFIISERKIYFNIVKAYPRMNPPVLFAHLILKHDLRKFFLENQKKQLEGRTAIH